MIRLAFLIALLAAPVSAQDPVDTTPLDTTPPDNGALDTTPLDNGAQGRIILLPEGSSQGQLITSPIDGSTAVLPDVRADDVRAVSGAGVRLKGLDKVSGDVTDLEMKVGETASVGRIEVTVGECRYPEDNATGEGYAWLTITDSARGAVLFEGWMVASSPALNALDHPRYDVWVIRCTTA